MSLGLMFFASINSAQPGNEFNMTDRAKKKAVDSGFAIVVNQVNDELSYHRTKGRALTPKEQAELDVLAKNKEHADKQIALADKQMEEADIDKLSKTFDTAQKLYALPGKQKSQKGKNLLKRIEKKLDELTKGLPELTEEELKEDDKKDAAKKSDQKDKKGLLSKLATPFVFVLSTAGNAADVVAGYSFAHVTNLDCFKDTLVQTPTFNRVLVIATIAGVTYGGYKLYKSQYDDEDDDNILDLD